MAANKSFDVTMTFNDGRPGRKVLVENCLNAPEARQRAENIYGGRAWQANQRY